MYPVYNVWYNAEEAGEVLKRQEELKEWPGSIFWKGRLIDIKFFHQFTNFIKGVKW